MEKAIKDVLGTDVRQQIRELRRTLYKRAVQKTLAILNEKPFKRIKIDDDGN